MIEFQELIDEIQLLERHISDQFKLLRALANFYVNSSTEEMDNQRNQIVKSLKEMEGNYIQLVSSWQKFYTDLKSQIGYEPEKDSHSELISKFMKIVLPIEMQRTWQPNNFSGSLLVFFENGKILSSSLIEKRIRPGHEEGRTKFMSKNGNKKVNESVTVIPEPEDSFTIVKSPLNSTINIYFSLQKSATVIVIIFNMSDQVVRRIEKKYDRAGEYAIELGGSNDETHALSKGNYYCQLQINDAFSEIKTIEIS